MVEYNTLKIGDKLQIVGAGAPGFAKLGDVVTVEKTGANRCDVVHDGTGERAYFALTCGAARLDRVQQIGVCGDQPITTADLREAMAGADD